MLSSANKYSDSLHLPPDPRRKRWFCVSMELSNERRAFQQLSRRTGMTRLANVRYHCCRTKLLLESIFRAFLQPC